MASGDARIMPIKNTAYRVTFPILDADGDLVTGATALDSEVSKDGGTFADCTNEATEIATSSGVYYLDLTSTEMNADTVAVIVKTTSSGAKTTTLVMYPVEAGDIDVDVTAWNGTAVATPTVAGVPEVDVTHWIGTAASTPTTAGVPEVDLILWQGVAPNALVSGRPSVNLQRIDDNATASDNLRDFALAMVTGAAVTGTLTTTAFTTGLTETTDDHYKEASISFRSGALAGQSRVISAYNGTTKLVTVDEAFTDAPANGDAFVITPQHTHLLSAIRTQVDDGIVAVNLDHLVGTATGIPTLPANTFLDQIADDGTATYDRTTDSLQAIRDRGDAAWTTGGGASLTDILNVVPCIPPSIDLADTSTWRIALMLTNALDDQPSTAEITPGTISIDRKAKGGTSWTAIVADAACSEAAGLVYYDEVFDTATGYAEGDSIRVTFKSQKVTVAANDYEITGTGGVIFYSVIRNDLSAAQVNAEADTAATDYGALKPTTAGRTLDVTTGGEAGIDWANVGSPTTTVGLSGTTVKTATDVEADTADIQTRIPAALTAGGNIKADTLAISGDTVAADNLESAADGTTYNLGGGAVVAASVTGNVTGSVGSLATQAKADVNAEVLDVLNVDTFAEPGQEAPAATNTLVKKIGYLMKFLRNKITQTSTTLSIYNDDAATVDHKATCSDDGTTMTRGEIGTGP